ncbi:helix-turn-helix domain-containing protein [Streptomyces sp. NPDC007904]|uniref:helix-turn-helix domain-containing protein n=1 Tax=Streptomyces sp. NPDC007904 TaxID=3364787 RepID=UPI0036E960B6
MSQDTAAAEFAARLRTLKERSGLSYGVLAKRLHMSTSTLHRYCNGDAVPTDYAPVERLARLCRASREELVELHRRWVLADADRGRKGAPSGTASAGSGETGPGEPGAGAAGSARAGGATREPETAAGAPEGTDPVASRERAEPVAPGEGDPEPEPVASGEGRPDPEPVPEPEAAARPGAAGPGTVTLPGTGAVTGPEDTAVPEIEIAEGGGSAGARPRRRTRTAVLAGIAVASALAGVALAVGLPGGGTDDSGRRGPVGAAHSGGGPGQQDVTSSPTSSASPSASASAGRRNKDDDKHKHEDGVEAGRGASASASPSPSAAPADGGDRGGVPLTVRAEPYAWESACSQRYLVDRPPSRVSPPPSEQDAPAWVGAAGAVSSGEQYVQLTVQGTGEETVVVEGIAVRVAGKRSPLAWNDFAMGYPGVGCGGDVPARSFTVALDAARPVVVPQSGHRDFPFKVSQSDPEVYYISADASAYDVRWYLELKWSSGTRSGTLTVDDRGRPFRVSGNNGRPAYEFPLGGDAWVPEGTTALD